MRFFKRKPKEPEWHPTNSCLFCDDYGRPVDGAVTMYIPLQYLSIVESSPYIARGYHNECLEREANNPEAQRNWYAKIMQATLRGEDFFSEAAKKASMEHQVKEARMRVMMAKY